MIVGIHTGQYGKFRPFIQKYEEILDFNGIEYIRLDSSDSDFWDKVKKVDLFIFRWGLHDWPKQLAQTILPIIENDMKIKCFPNQATCWHYDDKIREYYLLKQYNYPMINSNIFWDRKKAIEWAETTQYPKVFKLTGGAGSRSVILIKNKRQAKKHINLMFGKGTYPDSFKNSESTYYKDVGLKKKIRKLGGNILRKLRHEDVSPFWKKHKNYVYFQDFMPNNEFDTRVSIVGEKAHAFRRFVRKNDFRASGSYKWDYDRSKINLEFIKIAFNISKSLNFQSMAYDFITDEEGKPALVEISYAYPDRAAFSDGYWDEKLIWHKGKYSPQYFQLMDALEMPELKMPQNITTTH